MDLQAFSMIMHNIMLGGKIIDAFWVHTMSVKIDPGKVWKNPWDQAISVRMG